VRELDEVWRSFRLLAPAAVVVVKFFVYEPSSLDMEFVFSKSTETVFDSLSSTEPLWLLFRLDTNLRSN
jgi:hypothetical protein